MALSVNTNIASLNAQRQLGGTQNAMRTAMERLSSGLRINTAKDDAAGLAISERMTAQIRGMNQAVRNANDAISLVQTAEGAMKTATDMLQRMRELAIQSANGSNSSSDRANLNAEVTQLKQALEDLTQDTSFNNQRLLDGSFVSTNFQVGANANQTIAVDIQSIKSSSIGRVATATGGRVSAATAADLTIAIGGGSATTITTSASFTGNTYQSADSAYAKVAAINDANISDLTATATNSGTATWVNFGGTAGDVYDLQLNGVAVYSTVSVASAALTVTDVRDAINSVSDQTGVIATNNGNALTLTAADGSNIVVDESGSTQNLATEALSSGDFDGSDAGAVTVRGTITLSSTDNIAIGGTVATINHNATISTGTDGIDDISIATASGAQSAILAIDSALKTVNTNRSSLGAIQNRLDYTIDSLQTNSENTSAARSRIVDADFAQETSNLTRSQILQQAGAAMLAQANASSQIALSLLG
jgi:flagellin